MTPADEARIERRLDRQDDVLAEIHVQVKTTNGRVTKLEVDAAVEKALREQAEKQKQRVDVRQSWLTPTVCTVGATMGATVLAHFLS